MYGVKEDFWVFIKINFEIAVNLSVKTKIPVKKVTIKFSITDQLGRANYVNNCRFNLDHLLVFSVVFCQIAKPIILKNALKINNFSAI